MFHHPTVLSTLLLGVHLFTSIGNSTPLAPEPFSNGPVAPWGPITPLTPATITNSTNSPSATSLKNPNPSFEFSSGRDIIPRITKDEREAVRRIIQYMLTVTRTRASRKGGDAPFEEFQDLSGTAMKVHFTPAKRPLIGHVVTNDEAIHALEQVRDVLPKWRGTLELKFTLFTVESGVRRIVQVLAEGRVYRGEVDGPPGGPVSES